MFTYGYIGGGTVMPKSIEIDLTQLTNENKLVTSIYKICSDINTSDELINIIKRKLDDKDCFKFKEINNDFFNGLVFSYKTTPVWSDAILELIDESEVSKEKESNDVGDDTESSNEDKSVERSSEVDDSSKENELNNDVGDTESSNGEEVNTSSDFELKNRYISYILIKSISTINEDDGDDEGDEEDISENIYAICGGFGYNIISEFIEKSFGLNLVPKLINDSEKVVKKVIENRLLGNVVYNSRRNRTATNLTQETDFSNIYKELEFSIDENILFKLGLINSTDEEITNNVISKDSFRISKGFTIEELSNLIEKLDGLQNEDAQFSLNYVCPANKKGYDNQKIKDRFVDLFKKYYGSDEEGEFDKFNFEIVGEDISKYSSNSTFELKCKNFSMGPKKKPITWKVLIEEIDDIKITKEFIKNLFFKSNLITYDDYGETQNTALINCLDGFLEDEYGDIFYLMNGTWYVFDEEYIDIANKQYRKIYDDSREYVLENILENFEILKNKMEECREKYGDEKKHLESKYNEGFCKCSEVIYADKQEIDNIEIADLIIPDTKNEILYLFCLKENFNGSGCRDLYGQIQTSYELLQSKVRYNIKGSLEAYLEKLISNNIASEMFEWENFRNYFVNYKIYYVAGFLNGLKGDTTSNYAKFSSHKTFKKINDPEYEFILMDFDFKIYD